uniref:Uncharacterized protein n=1 Tax=Tanacetum cinerariifolium TaxID=118510 RepID=A0A699GXL8_TANCI|nr:hypothetical protein [Tanacetum cinerariifolium]
MAIPVVLPEIALEAAAVVALPTTVLDLAIESDLEAEPSEEPPSPDYVPSSPIHAPASPDYHPKSDIRNEPFEDEAELTKDAPEVAEPLSAQVAPPPPVHSTPTLPTSFVELTPTTHTIPHDTRATASASSILSSVPVDQLPPRKRLRGLVVVSYQDVTIEAITEPAISLIHYGLTVEEILDEHNEVIGEMYDNLLEIRLPKIKEIEEKFRTLRARVVSSKRENISLHARVKAAKLSDDSTRVALQTARIGLSEMRRQVRDTVEQLH